MSRLPSVNQQYVRPIQLEAKENDAVPSANAAARDVTVDRGTAASAASNNGAVARMEIQTGDPNIRIIWLTPKKGE